MPEKKLYREKSKPETLLNARTIIKPVVNRASQITNSS